MAKKARARARAKQAEQYPHAMTDTVSMGPKTNRDIEGQGTEQTTEQIAEQGDKTTAEQAGGDVSAIATLPADTPPSRTRTESKLDATNRWRKEGIVDDVDEFRATIRHECRAKGMSGADSRDYAWECAIATYPAPGVDPTNSAPLPSVEPTPPSEQGRVQGLGAIPASWPPLPPNASLQAELSWCQANRLTVIEETASGATHVHLDRASTPAPSMSAIGWLETSIRSYAKYVDVVARALSTQQDEATHVRRERAAIEDIRALLAEMLDGE